MNYRRQQINNLIRNELSHILSKEVEFPLGILATLTSVEIADEPYEAVVFMSVLPSERKEEVFAVLKERRGELQTLLYKRAKSMMLPPIRFEYYEGAEKSAKIEKLSLEN